ncbi:hypothetical protein DPX82_19535 [Salmonella enterica]|nr:hypothetical protein [Salmonella enterica]EBS3849543.1 hypothetical protein [Salmonella enterica subsp. enterica serovar Java]EAP7757885.1 hypothetical protein [Salmonella enterica]EAR3733858.1 hypothetical protein [Salmonella enterica]EBI2963989.1 hypothetical protein [Salmonella enterica]
MNRSAGSLSLAIMDSDIFTSLSEYLSDMPGAPGSECAGRGDGGRKQKPVSDVIPSVMLLFT